jgi:hypothetical protein
VFDITDPGPVEVGVGPLSVTPELSLSNDPVALDIRPETTAE